MNSKAYAFFLVKDLTNKTVEATGSDGYLSLDARLSVGNMFYQTKAKMNQLNQRLNKEYIGFNLYRGKQIVSSVVF